MNPADYATGREGEVARAAVKSTGKMLKGMFYDPVANLAELEKWKAYNNGEGGVYYMDPQGKMHTEQDYQSEMARRSLAVVMMGIGLNSAPGLAVKTGPGVVLGANRVGLPAAERAAAEQAVAEAAASRAVKPAIPSSTPTTTQLPGPPAVEVTTPTRAEAQYWSSRFGRNMPIQDANVVEAAATPPPQLAGPRVRGNVNPIGTQGPIPLSGTVAEQAPSFWDKALNYAAGAAGVSALGALGATGAGYFFGDKNKAPNQAQPVNQNMSLPEGGMSSLDTGDIGMSPYTKAPTTPQVPTVDVKAKGRSAFKGKGGAGTAGAGTGAGAGAGAKAAGAAGAAAPATAAMPTPTATPNIPMDASGRPNFNYYSEMLNSADANNAYYRDFVNLREQARMAAIEAGNRGESYRFVPIRDVKSNRVYFVNANGNDIALDMNDKQDRERFNKIVEQSGVDPIKMSEWMSRSSRPLMRHMMPGGGYQEAAPDFNFNRQRAQESVDTQGNKLQYYSDVNRAPVPSQQPGQQAVKPTTTPAAEMPTPTAQVPTPATQTPEQPKPTGSIFDWANVSPDQAYQLAQAEIIAKRKQAGMTPAQQRQIDANKGRVRW